VIRRQADMLSGPHDVIKMENYKKGLLQLLPPTTRARTNLEEAEASRLWLAQSITCLGITGWRMARVLNVPSSLVRCWLLPGDQKAARRPGSRFVRAVGLLMLLQAKNPGLFSVITYDRKRRDSGFVRVFLESLFAGQVDLAQLPYLVVRGGPGSVVAPPPQPPQGQDGQAEPTLPIAGSPPVPAPSSDGLPSPTWPTDYDDGPDIEVPPSRRSGPSLSGRLARSRSRL
jgi:hypothetical protein